MYRRIVVPLDGSRFAERAIDPAVELAEATGAQPVLIAAGADHRTGGYLRDLARAQRLPAAIVVNDDTDAAASIAAMAAPDTLISMATHGRTGVRRAVVGSVAEHVLRTVREPVLLTGPVAWRRLHPVGGTMLVCLDGSERAEAILPAARDWAKELEMHLSLVTVVDRSCRADPDVLDPGYLASTAHGLGLPPGQVEWSVVEQATAAGGVLATASRTAASVVALATHGRGGVARAMGSVAMEVACGAPCSVLMVRAARA